MWHAYEPPSYPVSLAHIANRSGLSLSLSLSTWMLLLFPASHHQCTEDDMLSKTDSPGPAVQRTVFWLRSHMAEAAAQLAASVPSGRSTSLSAPAHCVLIPESPKHNAVKCCVD